MKISCLLVDDDPVNISLLRQSIEENCSHLQVTSTAGNISEAEEIIRQKHPDAVFLDVEMPGGTGFELLTRFDSIPFKIVFTTAHEHYALSAIKSNAVDYLLKPIDDEDLKTTEQKLVDVFQSEGINESYQNNVNKFVGELRNNKPRDVKRLVIPNNNGFKVVEPKSIEFINAENNYSNIFFDDKSKLLASKTLKEMEDILSEKDFIRVHKSHIININKLKEVKTGDYNKAIMNSGMAINISRRRLNQLINKLNN